MCLRFHPVLKNCTLHIISACWISQLGKNVSLRTDHSQWGKGHICAWPKCAGYPPSCGCETFVCQITMECVVQFQEVPDLLLTWMQVIPNKINDGIILANLVVLIRT